MIVTNNGYKVYNFQKVVSESENVPYGFHVETWGIVDRDKKEIVLYTSDYLSQNSWTTNHPDNEICFVNEYGWLLDECSSWRESLRQQLEDIE